MTNKVVDMWDDEDEDGETGKVCKCCGEYRDYNYFQLVPYNGPIEGVSEVLSDICGVCTGDMYGDDESEEVEIISPKETKRAQVKCVETGVVYKNCGEVERKLNNGKRGLSDSMRKGSKFKGYTFVYV